MSVKVGGIYVLRPETRAANGICGELDAINGEVDHSDFLIDLCFLTYVAGGLGAEYAEGVGIRPGMVGRKQHRFIVNLEVPPLLADREAYAAWVTEALAEAAEIVRSDLPRKAKAYPASRLAAEVEALRERWILHINATV